MKKIKILILTSLIALPMYSFLIQEKTPGQEILFPPSASVDSTGTHQIPVDIESSVVYWRGTKLLRTGSHEGTLNLKDGRLFFDGDSLTGGYFIADMKSITVTDIPAHETIARRNLTNHLKSDFESRLFPEAIFSIQHAEYAAGDSLHLTGEMTIRGITRPLRVLAKKTGPGSYTCEFTFNRFDWGIGENGSWLEKRLVDADVQVRVDVLLP